MSLLIKALEQSAKDRTSPRIEPRSPSALRKSPDPAREPTLEAAPPPRSVVSHSRARGGAASGTREGVAHVLAYLHGNPIMMLAAVAVLCGIGFGIYVYLEIAKPDMFMRQGTPRAQQTTPQPLQDTLRAADEAPAAAQSNSDTPAPGAAPVTSSSPDSPSSRPPMESPPAAVASRIITPTSAQSPPPLSPTQSWPIAVAALAGTPAEPAAQQADTSSASEARPARKPIATSTVVAAAELPEAAEPPPPADPRTERANSRKSAAASRAGASAATAKCEPTRLASRSP